MNKLSQAELLLCDVGNTNIKLALADGERLIKIYNLPNRIHETEDSLGLQLCSLLTYAGFNANKLKACVISSVSPALDPVLLNAVKHYIGCPVFFVPRDLAIPIENKYPRPQETGADRLVCAYAARLYFPDCPAFLVVDFGTAVTFDLIKENSYLGGLIFPGPGIASQALANKTAKLPHINFDFNALEPQTCVDTETSIQHGIIFGYQALVEGLCKRLTASLPAPVKIIGTGAFAFSLEKISKNFDLLVPALVLDGLRNLYYTQKEGSTARDNV